MSEPRFTPGPWSVVDHNWQDTGIYSGDYHVAGLSLSVEDEEDEASIKAEGAIVTANAHLIAAAPELYAALEGVIRVADRKTVEFDAAHAALRKARGEAP